MATMPYTPDSPTMPSMPRIPDLHASPNNPGVVADTVLMTLRAHYEDRPNGFEEMEMMQIHPTLKLLALRDAVRTLVDQGKVAFLHEHGSQARIKLL